MMMETQHETHNDEHGSTSDESWSAPATDLYESDTEFLFKTDVPGVSRENVSIDFDNGKLKLQATRTEDTHQYRRTLRLRRPINSEAISAELRDGVLEVHLPKRQESVGRTIPVQ